LKKFIALSMSLVLALVLTGAASAATQLKFSSASPITSTWQLGAEKFAQLVEKGTKGKYKITVFPSDQLSGGNQVSGIELVQTGNTDIHLQDALVWSAVAKKAIVPCFPWLLPSYKEVDKYMKGAGGEALKKVLDQSGVVCLAIGENGYRQVVNNKRPIEKPADMKALKMRVPGSKVHVQLLKYLGADPLTMSQSEVYTSLQQGTIDACENTLDLLITQNTLEVTKYLTFWNYSYDPIFLSVSKELWAKLSPAEKKIFQKAADDAMAYQIKATRDKEKVQHGQLGKYKIKVVKSLTPANLAAFKKGVAKIYTDYKNEFGADLFAKFGYKF